MRPLDDFLPAYEFSERHSLAIDAPAGRIDQALRAVSIADIPAARALWRLRGERDPGRPTLILLLRAARRRAEARA